MSKLERKLALIKEGKRKFEYVTTGELWDYVNRVNEIDSAPEEHTDRIKQKVGLDEGSYHPRPERLYGIMNAMQESSKAGRHLIREVFDITDFDEDGLPSKLRKSDQEKAEEFKLFFYEKPDLVTFLYSLEGLGHLEGFLPENMPFHSTGVIMDILFNHQKPKYSPASQTTREIMQSCPPERNTRYLSDELADLFEQAHQFHVGGDHHMVEFLGQTIEEKLDERKKVPGIGRGTIQKVKSVVLRPFREESAELTNYFSVEAFERERSRQKTYARTTIGIDGMINRMKKDGVARRTKQEQGFIDFFLWGETRSYDEIIRTYDALIRKGEERSKKYSEQTDDKAKQEFHSQQEEILSTLRFIRETLGRQENYAKKII